MQYYDELDFNQAFFELFLRKNFLSMKKHIALLRGINVGGHKKIKMVDLRSLVETEGFTEVRTYIQSGNIVFSSSLESSTKMAETIESLIEKKYGFKVPTLVINHAYLTSVLEQNPYAKDESKEEKKMYFGFLFTNPAPENIAQLNTYDFPNESIIIKNNIAYAYYGNGAANSKFTGNFIENKLKVTTSSRNLNTVKKLIEMSKI